MQAIDNESGVWTDVELKRKILTIVCLTQNFDCFSVNIHVCSFLSLRLKA